MMRASVVIPTFNRLGDLQRVVAAIGRQARPPACEVEVVIVDDGSEDGTGQWLRRRFWEGSFKVVEQTNSGPARARNRGVEAATGEIVLFLGDDTEPQPGWLLAHVDEHRLFARHSPLAVVGYTGFPPQQDSSFLRWINEYGAQFGYQLIDDPRDVRFNFFYTSNLSVSRDLLLRLGGFREDFPAAAWEDIELAYRATREGLTIRYQPRARTVHHHRIQPRTFCRRQRTSGQSAAIFAGLHPDLEEFLGVGRVRGRHRHKRFRRCVLAMLVDMGEKLEGLVPAAAYREYLDLCYLDGLAKGLHLR